MRWGLDAAFPPDEPTARAWFGNGWTFFAGYIGGHAMNVWAPEDFRRLADVGFDLLPIFVAPLVEDAGHQAGVDDGNACIAAMQERGLSGRVALDVENDLTPEEYARGFLDASAAGSLGVVLYGTSATIRTIGGLAWADWWLANWSVPGQAVHAAPPDFELWQFQEGPVADYNVCTNEFQFASIEQP